MYSSLVIVSCHGFWRLALQEPLRMPFFLSDLIEIGSPLSVRREISAISLTFLTNSRPLFWPLPPCLTEIVAGWRVCMCRGHCQHAWPYLHLLIRNELVSTFCISSDCIVSTLRPSMCGNICLLKDLIGFVQQFFAFDMDISVHQTFLDSMAWLYSFLECRMSMQLCVWLKS